MPNDCTGSALGSVGPSPSSGIIAHLLPSTTITKLSAERVHPLLKPLDLSMRIHIVEFIPKSGADEQPKPACVTGAGTHQRAGE